ncbi:MAG: hypothetical protein LBM96_03920 [Methanobrevibacter sp.]|jgi:hypothetical protein|nr:hypothetical protein [Candidatus Methanoflexus mossambicus]
MIKNFKEWRKCAAKLSDKNITVKESIEIKKQLNEYEKKNIPKGFVKWLKQNGVAKV